MILGELLRQHGIASAAEPGRRLDITRQQAWLLWTGRHLPSYEILQRLAAMDMDPQDLVKLERAKPPTNGRRRKGRSGTRSTGGKGGPLMNSTMDRVDFAYTRQELATLFREVC